MAAGFGNRMKPLSDRCPKPLLPVLGRPLIDYTITHLKTVGIRKIGINVCHLADKMESYLKDGSHWEVEICISREKEILGTGGGIRAMREFLSNEGPFLVYNGDILTNINLPELRELHFQRAPLITMALCDFAPKNNVSLSRDGTIEDFSGKLKKFRPGKDHLLTFTGVSIVDPNVFDFIPRGEPSNIIDIYLDLIIRKPGSIKGYILQGKYWMDIGSPESYLHVHKDILLNGKLDLFPNEGSGIYKGSGSRIEAGAQLEGFISLGNNCVVEKEVFLKNCAIWDNTVVGKGTHLENGVIDGDWKYSIPDGEK